MKATTQTGFTLIELMVTVSVVAVLTIIAIPAFRGMLANSSLNAAQEDFIQILNKGRGMAMARSTISTVSISGNVATLTLADGSASAVTATAGNRVAINEAATYIFDPVGTATVNSASGATILRAPGFSEIPPRTITVSAMGVVNVSR
ncbi:MAG: prepilin-type N-terminal cleavage/methylation domain-containing protein [Nitrosomonadales bacterium]|nr:prepilin-type N-terminal cleavage/methylation domain-containing protein [Nitrosomonadales bacterium]